MNLRHSAALLLFAFGSYLVLAGSIFSSIGMTSWIRSTDQTATTVSLMFGASGVIGLATGLLVLMLAFRSYRHYQQLSESPWDPVSPVMTSRRPAGFPPIVLILYALATVLLGVTFLDHGIDFRVPRALEAYLGWAVLTVLFLWRSARLCYEKLANAEATTPPNQGSAECS